MNTPNPVPAPADRRLEDRRSERESMVTRHLVARDIVDRRVLAAMAAVHRHRFAPSGGQEEAYDDHPLPIGHGQTLSQPYIVALMTQLLELAPEGRVLEVGTGCGYQTAVLAALAREVYTVEIIPELSDRARFTLRELGVGNVGFRTGDGRLGWPERAPFDGIIVTAAPASAPPALLAQLAEGGRLVIPLGAHGAQTLHRFVRRGGRIIDEEGIAVRFVPLVGG